MIILCLLLFVVLLKGLIQFGLLDILSSLIKHRKVKVQRLALSTLSNVSASGGVVVSYLMQHKVIIMDVLNAIQIGDFIVKFIINELTDHDDDCGINYGFLYLSVFL